jgi:hypothetical protein
MPELQSGIGIAQALRMRGLLLVGCLFLMTGLQTGDLRPVVHNGLTIALVQLSPYPFSARTIAPEEYRATLKVTH